MRGWRCQSRFFVDGAPEESIATMADAPLIRLYMNMVASLEAVAGAERMAEILRAARECDLEEGALALADDGDVPRMLRRIGLLPAKADREADHAGCAAFVRDAAQAVGRSPAQVGVVARVYATGWYGVAEAICGPMPRCRSCGLTKDCDYFNRPPARHDEKLRPLKRLARDGAESLGDDEVLDLLIGGGRDSAALARTLLERFGSLRGLARAEYGELRALRDVSESVAARLAAWAILYRRLMREERPLGARMRSGKDFYDLFGPELRDREQEVFLVVLLDQKHQVMRHEVVSEGTLTQSLIHPREVFLPAIRTPAAAVAFLHNHPSGDPEPSEADRLLTQRLNEVGRLLGIRVLDHVIIGEGRYYSFVDEGLL